MLEVNPQGAGNSVVGGSFAVLTNVLGVVTPVNNTTNRTGELATNTNLDIQANTAYVQGAVTPFDRGGGIFNWTSDVVSPDNGGTVIVPNINGWVRTGCWKRDFTGPLQFSWFGALFSNTNDRLALQNGIDALGSTTRVRSTMIVAPTEGVALIDQPLVFQRKSGHVIFPGWGGETLGTYLKWIGLAGLDMVQIIRCVGLCVEGMRLWGNPAARPGSGINCIVANGDSPYNSGLTFRRIYMGRGLDDTTLGSQFDIGFQTSGYDAHDDQSTIDTMTMETIEQIAVKFGNGQNTEWHVKNLRVNDVPIAMSTATRWVKMDTCTFGSVTDSVVVIENDGNILIENSSNEGCHQWVRGASASSVLIRNSYFQSDKAIIPANLRVIEMTSAGISVQLDNVNFTRAGAWNPGDYEQLYVRGTDVFVELTPSVAFVGTGVVKPHLDIDTNGPPDENPNDTCRVVWGREGYINVWKTGYKNKIGERVDGVTYALSDPGDASYVVDPGTQNPLIAYNNPTANRDVTLPDSATTPSGMPVIVNLRGNAGNKNITVKLANAADSLLGVVNGTLVINVARTSYTFINWNKNGVTDWLVI